MDKKARRSGSPRLGQDELRQLARDVATRRESAYAEVRDEVDLLKAELRRRAEAIAERERELAELEGRLSANGLAAELAAARRAAAEADSERRLAAAERERLDEREQQIRTVEKELAARRRELDDREAAVEAREAEGLTALTHPEPR